MAVDTYGRPLCDVCFNYIARPGYGGRFTDDPLKTPHHWIPSLRGYATIRKRHLQEIQSRINSWEQSVIAGKQFPDFTITKWSPMPVIRAQHINECREALEKLSIVHYTSIAGYLSQGIDGIIREPGNHYYDWSDGHRLDERTPIRAIHIEELRMRDKYSRLERFYAWWRYVAVSSNHSKTEIGERQDVWRLYLKQTWVTPEWYYGTAFVIVEQNRFYEAIQDTVLGYEWYWDQPSLDMYPWLEFVKVSVTDEDTPKAEYLAPFMDRLIQDTPLIPSDGLYTYHRSVEIVETWVIGGGDCVWRAKRTQDLWQPSSLYINGIEYGTPYYVSAGSRTEDIWTTDVVTEWTAGLALLPPQPS